MTSWKHLSDALKYSQNIQTDTIITCEVNERSSEGLPEPLCFFDEHEILNMPELQIDVHYCTQESAAAISANVQDQSSNFPMSDEANSQQQTSSFVRTHLRRPSHQFYSYSDNERLSDMLSNQSSALENKPYSSVPVSHLLAGNDEKYRLSIQSLVTHLNQQPSECRALNKSSTDLLDNLGTSGARMESRAKFPYSVPQFLQMPLVPMPVLSDVIKKEPMIVSSTISSMVSRSLSSQPLRRLNTTCLATAPTVSLQTSDEAAETVALPMRGRFLEAVMRAGPLLQQLLVIGLLPDWNNPPPMVDIPVVPVPSNAVPHTYMMNTHVMHT